MVFCFQAYSKLCSNRNSKLQISQQVTRISKSDIRLIVPDITFIVPDRRLDILWTAITCNVFWTLFSQPFLLFCSHKEVCPAPFIYEQFIVLLSLNITSDIVMHHKILSTMPSLVSTFKERKHILVQACQSPAPRLWRAPWSHSFAIYTWSFWLNTFTKPLKGKWTWN